MKRLVFLGWLNGAVVVIGLAGCVGTVGESGTVPGGQPEDLDSPSDRPSPASSPDPSNPTSAQPERAAAGGLLPCDPRETALWSRRIWRLSAKQYQNTVAALFDGRPRAGAALPAVPGGIESPFDVREGATRYKNYALTYGVTDGERQRVLEVGSEVARKVVAALRARPGSCLADRAAFASCVGSIVADKGAVLFRRPLTPEELAAFSRLATDHVADLPGGPDEALALALEAMLASPHFLFRTEVGEPAPKAGTVALSPFEVASFLSYALTDAPADDQLWAAAAAGMLSTPAQVKQHALRLLSRAADLAPVGSFFEELLHFDKTTRVAKDESFKFHNPESLVNDTRLLVRDLLRTNAGAQFFRNMLTTPRAMLSKGTALSYGMPSGPEKPTMVNLPATERAGLLTQPSFLSAYSLADRNEPVQRGRFVSENLLCQTVPDLPIDADVTLLDLGPTATLRERVAATTMKPECQGCHASMNPLGFVFEMYDHLGRIQRTEAGRPIDARGALPAGPGLKDGPVANAVELMGKLAASPAVEQCLTRQIFRYLGGRQETPADACAVVNAHQAYVKSDGNLLELLATLLSSDTFLRRAAN